LCYTRRILKRFLHSQFVIVEAVLFSHTGIATATAKAGQSATDKTLQIWANSLTPAATG